MAQAKLISRSLIARFKKIEEGLRGTRALVARFSPLDWSTKDGQKISFIPSLEYVLFCQCCAAVHH